MSTRKTDADIRCEDRAQEINAGLVGTSIRADPGRDGTFLVSIGRVAPADLPRLLDNALAITGREPRARPWRPAPARSPEDRP